MAQYIYRTNSSVIEFPQSGSCKGAWEWTITDCVEKVAVSSQEVVNRDTLKVMT